MAGSSDVVANNQILATDYNKLRADVLDNATGHDHEDPDGKRLAKNALRWTANKLLLGAGAAEPTEVEPGITLTVAETEVFNGNSPNPSAWTDLNLAATIGANPALVLLKFYNSNAAAGRVAFRPDGDADESYGPSLVECAGGTVPGTTFAYFIIATSAVGVVEWIFFHAGQAGTTIDVAAYIK